MECLARQPEYLGLVCTVSKSEQRKLCFDYWLNRILLLISGLTIFIAGLDANFEYDLKKIIALSTLSQYYIISREKFEPEPGFEFGPPDL